MTKRLVSLAIINLNSFLLENSISKKYSLLSIMTNLLLLNTRSYSLEFGSYAETFEDSGLQHNLNKLRSTHIIVLDPLQYYKLGYIFILLVLEKRLRRRK